MTVDLTRLSTRTGYEMPWKRKTHDQRVRETQKPAPPMKPRKSTKIYGHRWRKARAAYLEKHPLCAECLKAGRHTLATEVDHTIAHRGDMKIFWDVDRWAAMCKPCHSKKTAREDGAFGRARKQRPEMDKREDS